MRSQAATHRVPKNSSDQPDRNYKEDYSKDDKNNSNNVKPWWFHFDLGFIKLSRAIHISCHDGEVPFTDVIVLRLADNVDDRLEVIIVTDLHAHEICVIVVIIFLGKWNDIYFCDVSGLVELDNLDSSYWCLEMDIFDFLSVDFTQIVFPNVFQCENKNVVNKLSLLVLMNDMLDIDNIIDHINSLE